MAFSHSLGTVSVLRTALKSSWISLRAISPPAFIISTAIWSPPGALLLLIWLKALSTSMVSIDGTSSVLHYIYILFCGKQQYIDAENVLKISSSNLWMRYDNSVMPLVQKSWRAGRAGGRVLPIMRVSISSSGELPRTSTQNPRTGDSATCHRRILVSGYCRYHTTTLPGETTSVKQPQALCAKYICQLWLEEYV